MIIIGFSSRTSRFLPRIFCRHFRHCAPIVVRDDGSLVMYQFVRCGNIAKISLRTRDIKILALHGWRFVYIPRNAVCIDNLRGIRTCVGLTKRMAGIRGPIWTPDRLYKKLAAMRVF